MKSVFRLLCVVFCLFTTTNHLQAQWIQTNGPYTDVYKLCGNDMILFANFGGDVFLSRDKGLTWIPLDSALINPHVNAFAISGMYFLVGTDGGGVYRSSDNGLRWTALTDGLTNPFT